MILEKRDYNAEYDLWFQKLLLYIEQDLGSEFEKERYDTSDMRFACMEYFVHGYTPENAWDEEKTY